MKDMSRPKGFTLTQLHKDRISKAHKGKKCHTDVSKEKISEAHRGENNYLWKGDEAGYGSIHMWLRREYGRPESCSNPECFYPKTRYRPSSTGKMYPYLIKEPKGFQWALKKGFNHSHNIEHYIGLCGSCHKLYDSGKLVLELTTN